MAVHDRGFNVEELVIGCNALVVLNLSPQSCTRWPRPIPLAQLALLAPREWRRAASQGLGADLVLPPSHSLQDAVSALLARTTAQLQAVERELAEERMKLECAEDEILEMGRKEELAEAVSER